MTDIGLNTQQKNLVMPTFLNMPLNVANLVLEKMEPMDLLRASKVCRSLRIAVDKFGFRFGLIRLNLWMDQAEIKLDGMEIIYTTEANTGGIVTRNRQEKLIDGENFVERAVEDFKIVSKHARKIKIWNYSRDRRDIVTTFIEFMKSEKCILVEEIELDNFSVDEILTILPCFNAKQLKKIELRGIESIDQFERITHSEQWENAEEFILWESNIASTMIVHLFHFKFFSLFYMDEFPAQTAIQIRDDLLKRSSFQSCKRSSFQSCKVACFEMSNSNPSEIAKIFKPDYAGGNEFKIEFSSGNNKFNILLEKIEHMHIFRLNVKRL